MTDVDARMGTMSKALGSIGGFVFSVGLAPSAAAASLKSIELMTEGPTRTEKLQENSNYFYDMCRQHKIPIGANTFRGGPVVVVMIGSTIATAKASEYLALNGVNVKPIVYPAVEEGKCRLRFFISAVHTKRQLDHTVALLATYIKSGFSLEKALGSSGKTQTTVKAVTTTTMTTKTVENGQVKATTVVTTSETVTESTGASSKAEADASAKKKKKKSKKKKAAAAPAKA